MVIISSEEFSNNQQKYFDLLDTNVQIVVQRDKDKAYLLTPLSDVDSLSTNPILISQVLQAEENIKNNEVVTIADPKNIWASIL